MKSVRELLRDADPLAHEPVLSSEQRSFRRETMLAAASGIRTRPWVGTPSRMTVFATVAFVVIVIAFLGARMWSPLVSDVHAAVRFEVRLAEDKPTPNLREAKVSGSDRSVYLYDEIIVTNGDISTVRVIQAGSPAEYSVGVEFSASGVEKMRAATGSHVGKLMAILLDGQVVMAPVIRTPISTAAIITGNFTRAKAEKLAAGIREQ
jgi:hypothetical protein